MKNLKTFEQFVLEAEALKAEDSKVYIDDVILQSGETLVNFDHLLSHQAWCDKQRTILVLPSARVAEQAKILGYQALLTSGSASNQAMCDTLVQKIQK